MKTTLTRVFLAFLLIIGAYSTSQAAFLSDWNIDTTGSGGTGGASVVDIFTLVNINGVGYAEVYDVDLTSTPPDLIGTFRNWGVWKATSTDDITETFPDTDGDGTIDWEITGIYKFKGDAVLGGALTFNEGTLDIYLDDRGSDDNYGTVSVGGSVLGANDDLKIASFDLLSGHGEIGSDGQITASNDNININYESSFLAPGYWTDSAGTDLSTLGPLNIVLGFSNTTAVTGAPQQAIIDEIYTDYAVTLPAPWTASQGPGHDPPEAIYMVNNGEFKLAVSPIPEPTTILLFGLGLIGLAGVSRKRFLKKD